MGGKSIYLERVGNLLNSVEVAVTWWDRKICLVGWKIPLFCADLNLDTDTVVASKQDPSAYLNSTFYPYPFIHITRIRSILCRDRIGHGYVTQRPKKN